MRVREKLYESKITCIHGINGSGKTKLLRSINNSLWNRGYNVIYFPSDRTMNYCKNDIENIDVMLKLLGKNSFKDAIESNYSMSDPFALNDIRVDDNIRCGYLQVVNFFYTIYSKLSDSKLNVIIIDNIELSLHALITFNLVFDFFKVFNIHKLIISTHSRYLIDRLERMPNKCKVISMDEIYSSNLAKRIV